MGHYEFIARELQSKEQLSVQVRHFRWIPLENLYHINKISLHFIELHSTQANLDPNLRVNTGHLQ